MLPAVGDPAPDFTLPSTGGGAARLASLRGRKVLLAFFPAAFTRVCTEEMCAFTEDFGQYAATQTVVLPISVDPLETLVAFREQEGLAMDLLSDSERTVSRAYGVLQDDRQVAHRAYVLVDRDGIVRWAHREATPATRRSTGELLARLRETP